MRWLRALLQVDREQLAQVAFEAFNVTGLYFADQAVLSLYSIGKSSGLVVDIGHEKTGTTLWRIGTWLVQTPQRHARMCCRHMLLLHCIGMGWHLPKEDTDTCRV